MIIAAETFPPGEFLKDELEARGWSQTEFAEVIGRPVRLVNEIIGGKKGITPETAVQLGESLGTGPELWMNLESQYQLSKVRTQDGVVARRAKLYERFPVREMIKRRWIEASQNIDVLEQQFRDFFGLQSLDDEPVFRHAAKKADSVAPANTLQMAWLMRAKQLALEIQIAAYQPGGVPRALEQLSALRSAPEETRHVARVLAEIGIRFVTVEAIPGSKIDGACFWLESVHPVIALSLRLDRIDNFWFVLRHELEHVIQGHGRDQPFILDQDLEGSSSDALSEEEAMANAAASEFCVPNNEMSGFMARVGPFYAEKRVLLFANRLNIHPGIVVGQLQRRLRRYDLFRKHQTKIRSFVSASSMTDGWGLFHSVGEA